VNEARPHGNGRAAGAYLQRELAQLRRSLRGAGVPWPRPFLRHADSPGAPVNRQSRPWGSTSTAQSSPAWLSTVPPQAA